MHERVRRQVERARRRGDRVLAAPRDAELLSENDTEMPRPARPADSKAKHGKGSQDGGGGGGGGGDGGGGDGGDGGGGGDGGDGGDGGGGGDGGDGGGGGGGGSGGGSGTRQHGRRTRRDAVAGARAPATSDRADDASSAAEEIDAEECTQEGAPKPGAKPAAVADGGRRVGKEDGQGEGGAGGLKRRGKPDEGSLL